MKAERTVVLPAGERLLIRSLRSDDAPQALYVCRKAAGETLFMTRYPDEWTIAPDQMRQRLREMELSERAVMLGAFIGETLCAAAQFSPVHPAQRMSHRACVGICVLKEHWHKGVGSAMMGMLIDLARRAGLEQLELDAAAENVRAQTLYRRFGFCEIGRHPRAFRYRDGSYADVVKMLLEL